MAKIEEVAGSTSAAQQQTQQKPSKKRKLKDIQKKASGSSFDDEDSNRSTEADSPTSKFKKLDISQITYRHRQRRDRAQQQQQQQQQQIAATVNKQVPSSKHQQNSAESAATGSTTASSADEQAAPSKTTKPTKANKRKVKSTPADADKAAKIAKRKEGAATVGADVDDHHMQDDGDAPREPTAAELNAADRPENQPQIETTRQKKRDKRAKVQLTAKVDSAEREQLRNREYLLQWRDRRTDWKFNKLRQISVTKSLFRDASAGQLDDELWQVAMDYLCGTKGQLRQLLRDAAQKVIDETDARIEAEGNEALVQEVNYTRARSFLQMME